MLRQAKVHLRSASDIVDRVIDEEQDSLDNIPENLQGSQNCEKLEDEIDVLENVIDIIESANENIDSII